MILRSCDSEAWSGKVIVSACCKIAQFLQLLMHPRSTKERGRKKDGSFAMPAGEVPLTRGPSPPGAAAISCLTAEGTHHCRLDF